MEYKYICNNSGCPVRMIGCPIPFKSIEKLRCMFCGHEMVPIEDAGLEEKTKITVL